MRLLPLFVRVLVAPGFLEPNGKAPMRDTIIAAVRTASVVAVTAFASWLLARFGIEIDVEGLTEIVFVVAVGLVNFALNELQMRFPWIGKMLSLGLSANGPTYR